MTQRMQVQFKPDSSGIEITFLPASGASGKLDLPADNLLSLIRQLGAVHAQLVASKPIPPLEGSSVDVIFNTRWFVQPEMLGEASVLSFHHPAFGPVGFAVPIDQIGQMVHLLTMQLQQSASLREAPQ